MNTTDKALNLTVSKEAAGTRLDRFLADSLPSHSRAFWQRLVKEGMVLLDGKICSVSKTELPPASEISITMPDEEHTHTELVAEKIPLAVLYEDADMLVLNKAAGMVVHPAAGNRTGTVANALAGRDPNFIAELEEEDDKSEEQRLRPGIVHRLDKDTSGCLVVAKNASSQFKLSRAFAERNVQKVYAAIVYGHLERKSGEIKESIGRHPVHRKKMAVNERGREAHSKYKALKSGFINAVPATLLEITILTGRTHQIRVHMSHIRHPVVGDSVYGGRQRIAAPRQMLHAWKLSIPRPADGEMLHFESPFPEDFAAMLDGLEERA